MTDLRTTLHWLTEQGIHDEAECWILGSDTVQPVVGVTPTNSGDTYLLSEEPWAEPAPAPLSYRAVCDILLESYAGGGSLRWATNPATIYRGSYSVNVENAVFFVFLPSEIEIVDSHEVKMEQRKRQAEQLTQEIERGEKPWVT
jgi:hypothetical protein